MEALVLPQLNYSAGQLTQEPTRLKEQKTEAAEPKIPPQVKYREVLQEHLFVESVGLRARASLEYLPSVLP